jgi:hypothetical protein
MVRSRGLEPPRVAPLAPQASASTNSATTACEADRAKPAQAGADVTVRLFTDKGPSGPGTCDTRGLFRRGKSWGSRPPFGRREHRCFRDGRRQNSRMFMAPRFGNRCIHRSRGLAFESRSTTRLASRPAVHGLDRSADVRPISLKFLRLPGSPYRAGAEQAPPRGVTPASTVRTSAAARFRGAARGWPGPIPRGRAERAKLQQNTAGLVSASRTDSDSPFHRGSQ